MSLINRYIWCIVLGYIYTMLIGMAESVGQLGPHFNSNCNISATAKHWDVICSISLLFVWEFADLLAFPLVSSWKISVLYFCGTNPFPSFPDAPCKKASVHKLESKTVNIFLMFSLCEAFSIFSHCNVQHQVQERMCLFICTLLITLIIICNNMYLLFKSNEHNRVLV